MSENNILKQLKPEEIIDSFVLPHGLKKADKKKADADLKTALIKKRALIDENQKVEMNLLQFKFQLEDYIKSNKYDEGYTFGFFLKSYLNALNKTLEEFADEIDVTQRSLNNWLNHNKVPNELIFVRLEIHSNNTIPAVNWLRIVEKKREYSLAYNAKLRLSQKAHVKKKLAITL
jgi:transcriptional regulator with XRE-family HTH domain